MNITIPTISGTKVFIIASLAACFVLSSVVGIVVWGYKDNAQKLLMEQFKEEQQKTLITELSKAIEKERKNNETTSNLEKGYLEKRKASSDVDLSKYHTKRGGVLIRGTCGKDTASNSNTPTASDASGTPSDSLQVCELSGADRETLFTLARQAQELRDRAELCRDYGKAIEKQIEDLAKQAK